MKKNTITHADVVIGANFGDEGKGLVTDFLAARYGGDALVVRFNGGSQAGHTVETPTRRHIFAHFGSGTLAGAATYLSDFFICDPIVFYKEHCKLQKLQIDPIVLVSPNALIATPYDVIINQIIEESRGSAKHGSCGFGIGETAERNQYPELALTVSHLLNNRPFFDGMVYYIRDIWVKKRLSQLGVHTLSDKWQTILMSEHLLKNYHDYLDFFCEHINVQPLLECDRKHIIFEGAQGLWLDQTRGFFPHVTRSNTGCTNVIKICQQLGIENLSIYYASRAYLTRHGQGPLPHELSDKPYSTIYDKTNVNNAWQGAFRHAFLDVSLLKKGITLDLDAIPSSIRYQHGLALTCLDQMPDELSYYYDNELHHSATHAFAQLLTEQYAIPVWLKSYGPTRDTIQLHNSA